MSANDKFINIQVGDLHLDPQNPRLPDRLKKASEKEVLNWMLTDATLIDLMASIAENNFFSGEPILVVQEDGKNIVVEGNRRLAAVKLLNNPELATESPRTVRSVSDIAKAKGNIPAALWVYLCLNREEAQNYLAFRHISGVKQWPLISKARYLYDIFLSKGRTDYDVYKELAREIGSKAAYVRKLLLGYQAFQIIRSKNWFGIKDLEEETFDLSLISEVINEQSAVASFIGVDTKSDKPFESVKLEQFEEVAKWLYQITENGSTRIGDNRNLRLLNKVLQNEEAKKAFIDDKKSITEAAELTDLADDNIRYYLQLASSNLIEAQRLVHKTRNPTKKDQVLLDDILSSAELIQSRLNKALRASTLPQ
jgi:hypothetical protein